MQHSTFTSIIIFISLRPTTGTKKKYELRSYNGYNEHLQLSLVCKERMITTQWGVSDKDCYFIHSMYMQTSGYSLTCKAMQIKKGMSIAS